MSELYAMFRRNFPFCVREEAVVRRLLSDPENRILERREADGRLAGAAVIQGNAVLMLCVDEEYRRRGIGSSLLRESERVIAEAGYSEIVIGAGRDYLMPGVPVGRPVIGEALEEDNVSLACRSMTADFFAKRGYVHSWDCNCFDMRFRLDDFSPADNADGEIHCRWARNEEIPEVVRCVERGFEKFARHYRREELYRTESRSRVLIALKKDRIVGALIVSLESEGEGVGSIGCTVVDEAHQGQGIATRLVLKGTESLRDAGMHTAFLGYTYSGLDRLYGRAGYRICIYYFMAKKKIA